jgi:DNA-binding PadR family transcriptional regulator
MLLRKEQMFEEGITERHVKTFLDILILAMLNGKPMYGYKLIAAVHREFGVLLSPGSLYPLLHSLEKSKVIESRFEGGKIVYATTPQGRRKFQEVFTAYKIAMQTVENFIKRHGENSP